MAPSINITFPFSFANDFPSAAYSVTERFSSKTAFRCFFTFTKVNRMQDTKEKN